MEKPGKHGHATAGRFWKPPEGEREILVFIGTCSVTTTLVSAFTKSDNRAKVKFSFDLLEPHIGSLLLAFLCLT